MTVDLEEMRNDLTSPGLLFGSNEQAIKAKTT